MSWISNSGWLITFVSKGVASEEYMITPEMVESKSGKAKSFAVYIP